MMKSQFKNNQEKLSLTKQSEPFFGVKKIYAGSIFFNTLLQTVKISEPIGKLLILNKSVKFIGIDFY